MAVKNNKEDFSTLLSSLRRHWVMAIHFISMRSRAQCLVGKKTLRWDNALKGKE
jgi:hypothetical protein